MLIAKVAWWLFFAAHICVLWYGGDLLRLFTGGVLTPLLALAFWNNGLKKDKLLLAALVFVWLGDLGLLIDKGLIQDIAVGLYFLMHLIFSIKFFGDFQQARKPKIAIGSILVWMAMISVLIVGSRVCMNERSLVMHWLVVMYGVMLVTNFAMSLSVTLQREAIAYFLQMVGYFMILLSDMYFSTSKFCGSLPYPLVLGSVLYFPGLYMLYRSRLWLEQARED